MENEQNPLQTLLDVIMKQFKAIAKTHTLLLKNYLAVSQKYSVVGPQPYDLTDFWSQAQSVVSIYFFIIINWKYLKYINLCSCSYF